MTHSPTPSPRKLDPPVTITGAAVVRGAGRGRGLGIPTINIEVSSAPKDLEFGIYACRITIDGTSYSGAMHYGTSPVFNAPVSLEVHVLDSTIESVPATVDILVVGRIRDVADFPSKEALLKRISQDIDETRAMLASA